MKYVLLKPVSYTNSVFNFMFPSVEYSALQFRIGFVLTLLCFASSCPAKMTVSIPITLLSICWAQGSRWCLGLVSVAQLSMI